MASSGGRGGAVEGTKGMAPLTGRSVVVQLFIDLLILLLSSLLFALSFPSFLSNWGWFPLAFISVVPVFIVVHRNGWLATVLFGALYGYTSYSIFNFWLRNFHPLAHIIVPVLYGGYFVLLFPILKLADKLFPRWGYLLQAGIWITYEYLRTLGFLGYSYGILGYSQYLFLPLIRIASVTGVWGVSLLVLFPSVYLGNALKDGISGFTQFIRRHKWEAFAFGAIFVASIGYGLSVKKDFSDQPSWRVALIQQNIDPWHGGDDAYRKSLEIHTKLSEEAEKSDPDIIIWSETAFVPGIDWHTRFRTNQERYRLVKQLTEYLEGREIPYIIGNDDRQLANPALDPTERNRIDYNAVLHYEGNRIVDTYRKIRLVPFTESFPFKEQLPGIYKWLKDADTHFWEKGSEYTVFEAGGVRFSTPICYEDSFGSLSRAFINEGAQVIANITQDSWSKSVAAEMQHMTMSVLRAVENKRTVVRSTNGGITCTIEPDGKITSMLEPFTENILVHDVPVYEGKRTLYTRWGDWFAMFLSIVSAIMLLFGIVKSIVVRVRRRD